MIRPSIDWHNTWQARRHKRIRPMQVTFDTRFWEHGLSDSFAVARCDDFGYGRCALDALGDQITPETVALEIGPGTGVLTFPLARRVARVVAIERSQSAVAFLMEKLAQAGLTNVEVRREDWVEWDAATLQEQSDLVVCSHFLWQVAYLESHLHKMERASRRLCAVIQAAHKVRGISDKGGLRAQYDRARRYAVPLLATAIRKAERTALAMDGRAFGAFEERTYYRRMAFAARDWWFIACFWLVSLALVHVLKQTGLLGPLVLLQSF